MRKARGLAGEPDDLQHVGHGLRDEAAALADDLQRERDVLVDGLVAKQPEVLEDDPEVATEERHFAVRDRGEPLAEHVDVARVGLLLAHHEPDHGAPAGARGSDEEHEFALQDLQGDAAEGWSRFARVRFRDVIEENHVGKRTHRAYGLRSGAPRSVGLTCARDHSAASLAACSCLRHRIPAAMKPGPRGRRRRPPAGCSPRGSCEGL